MNDDSENRKNLAWAQFVGLRSRAPSDWDEHDVRNYHEIVTALETAYGSDLSLFRVPNDRIKPKMVSFQRGGLSGHFGARTQYSDRRYCDESFVRQQIEALDAYLQILRAARPQVWGGATTMETAPPFDGRAEAEPRRYIEVPGPEELVLHIEPYAVGYVWKLRNGSLRPVSEACVRITSTQSFDSRKGAFREPVGCNVQWRIRNIAPGELTGKGVILVRIIGDGLELGETSGLYPLSWPNGDPSNMQRWLLEARIMGLWNHCTSKLDLRWTAGTKIIELTRYEDSSGGSEPSVPAKTNERQLIQGPVVPIFPGQEYPRYMHHATEPPRIVNSAREQAELGPEWSEKYIHQGYPKCKYHWKGRTATATSPEEEAALGGGWADSPAAFHPYQGPRGPRTRQYDATKWIDDWAMPGLTEEHRRKIKAQLLRVDATFWNLPDIPYADIQAMRQAYGTIARLLSENGLLSEALLHDEIPRLVWDCAISGGWYRFASDSPSDIFPEKIGHYWVWREDSTDSNALFYPEPAEWLAWLLENSGEAASSTGRERESSSGTRDQTPHPSSAGIAMELDFTSKPGRAKTLADYTRRWTDNSWDCSEAALARTARVNPADLSKWKKGLLPAGSDKAKRIERVLKNNEPPTRKLVRPDSAD